MPRLIFLLLLALPLPAAEPPNVLVLFADDWRNDTLGAAGNPVVRTPRLDRLADEGVRFTNAYVTTSICGVSRASLFTGQWMSRHGCTGFEMFDTPWSETYPGLLREQGYWTGHVGKWHNGRFPAEHFDFGRSYGGRHWYDEPDGSRIHVTKRNERDSLEFLRGRPTDRPFVLTVAFFAAHAEDSHPDQFLPQPESMSLYQDATIPVPETATRGAFEKLPDFIGNERNEGRNRWTWRFDTPEKFQTYMKNYYRLVTEVDITCGVILDELERQGVLDDTLVIFAGDNGYFHGEHGLADKWYPYEESIRVPLIIRDPRLPAGRRGKPGDRMALNVDLAPTILGFTGIGSPETMQGRDLSNLYLGAPPDDWRNEFYYEHPTIRDVSFIPASQALVTGDWKYIRWPDFDREQLFRISADPHEQSDLAGSDDTAGILEDLRGRFETLRAAAR